MSSRRYNMHQQQQYMVSYQLRNDLCGNKSGTMAEVNAYAEANKDGWRSHQFFICHEAVHGVGELTQCTPEGTPIYRG
jgi:hypothetical protein